MICFFSPPRCLGIDFCFSLIVSDCDESFLTYREFTSHVTTQHKDPFGGASRNLACPKQPNCWYAAVIGSYTLPVTKAKYFIHHYMRDHKIKRYLCRYCPTSFSVLLDAYAHLADAHPAYPIDIIVREYKNGVNRMTINTHNEADYELLLRIREDVLPEDAKATETTEDNEQTQQKPPVVLNQFLGMPDGSFTSLVSSILDEPLVSIDGQPDTTDTTSTVDPLNLENDVSAIPTPVNMVDGVQTAMVPGGDSDASNQNFDALSASNVR